MTIRVSHRKNYTCLSNAAIRDKRLSFKARGLHHLLLSYPDGWKVKIEHLVNESDKDGRTAIASALHELEECGYLTREQTRDPKTGRLGEWETVIWEHPETAIAKPENGQSEEQVYRDRETCNIINTDSDQITKKEVSISPLTPQQQEGGESDTVAESVKEVSEHPSANDPEISESAQQNKPSSGAIIPRGENHYQIQPLNSIQQIFEESGKVPSYGIEYKTWIQAEMGDIIKHYRRSGRALNVSPNDIDAEFKSFTAANANGGKGLKLAAAQGWIVNCEKDPLRWGELRDLVAEWLLVKQTGDRHTSIAQQINRASKPPIKLNLNY
ncbi:helix-turn-helix domain-containing protein [Nostoc sp. DSM 114161]|jgi:hypothetical protein|uniref:hypothetical protein n=1 Tax=Nostoc sp. DSM 114161 TaxID=3440143 RepID=UPI0040456BAC